MKLFVYIILLNFNDFINLQISSQPPQRKESDVKKKKQKNSGIRKWNKRHALWWIY